MGIFERIIQMGATAYSRCSICPKFLPSSVAFIQEQFTSFINIYTGIDLLVRLVEHWSCILAGEFKQTLPCASSVALA